VIDRNIEEALGSQALSGLRPASAATTSALMKSVAEDPLVTNHRRSRVERCDRAPSDGGNTRRELLRVRVRSRTSY
jgi:hypothetical protein